MKSLILYLLSALTAIAAPGEIIIQQEQATTGGTPKYRELRLTPINGRVFGWNGTALTNVDLSGYALTSSLGTLATQNGTFSGSSSGTNTGDETAATIKSKLGIVTLSGSNTGDQDLSGYATTAALGSGLAEKQNSITFGSGVLNALGINVGTSGSPVLNGGALGTPLSGNLANCTLPTISLTGDATGSGTSSIGVTVSKLNGTTLSSLATGLLKNTTATGVPSIAVAGTDYVVPSGSITGSAASLSLSGGGTVTGSSGAISLTASGTNQNINLVPSGTGWVATKMRPTFAGAAYEWGAGQFGIVALASGGASISNVFAGQFLTAASTGGNSQTAQFDGSNGLLLNNTNSIKWSNNSVAGTGSNDVGLFRNAAGVLEINSGTSGTLRDITLRNISASGTLSVTGASTFAAGAAATPSINFSGFTTTGFYCSSAFGLNLAMNGVDYYRFSGSNLLTRNDFGLCFSSTSAPSGTADSAIFRKSAGIIRISTSATPNSSGSLECTNGTFLGAVTTTGTTTATGGMILPTATTPASATATGTTGTICWDSSFIYVCTAPNTWKRVAISTW